MSAQLKYGYSTPSGVAGGIVDLAPYAIDTLLNGEEVGVMKFGSGVVTGDKAGTNAKLPSTKTDKFEGILTNNRTTEFDMEGNTVIKAGAALGIMRYGRVYARVASNVSVSYGDKVYLITTGDDKGCFTNVTAETNIAVKGRFLSSTDTTAKIAEIELFNQEQ